MSKLDDMPLEEHLYWEQKVEEMTQIKPRRIQRKRTKGFRLAEATDNPNGVVYVGRPTNLGSPFKVSKQGSKWMIDCAAFWHLPLSAWPMFDEKDEAIKWSVKFFEYHVEEHKDFFENELKGKKGKDLACFCPLDQPCHADVLLELTNKD